MAMTVTKDRVAEVLAAVRKITREEVVIGIPLSANERPPEDGKPSPIGNAAIGYINEFGVPSRNIPARAHLIPGIEASKSDIEKYLKSGVRRALSGLGGADDEVSRALDKVGLACVSNVKKVIQTKIPPPLSRAAVLTRWNRQKSRQGTPVPASFVLDATPLINTGDYIRSITYVIRERDDAAMAPPALTGAT